MVWGFFRVDPLPGDKDYYFFKTGSYKVGRKGCEVIVNDKGVSRIHAEILVDEMNFLDHMLKNPSNNLSNVRIRDCSEYGTFIKKNLGSMEKVHEFPNKETVLTDGDLVSFGTGNATYRFSYVSFIFYICSPKNTETNQLITTKVSSIGANITTKWSLDCSHVLVDDSFPLTEDLIDAIVARKPLVQYSWIELIAGKSICTDIPSCNSHVPNLMLEGVSVKVVDPRSRESCLKGYTFLLKAENKYKFEGRLQSLLEVGGAIVSSAEMAPVEENGEGCVVAVVPAGSSSFSLPWVREIDLVSAVLMGYFHPSLLKSPTGTDYARMIHLQTNTFCSGVRVGKNDLPNWKDLPEFDPEDYSSMPVDAFGKAYLKAYGHDTEEGEILEGEILQSAVIRQEFMGLGYVPPKVKKDAVLQPLSQDEDQSEIAVDKLNLLLDTLASPSVLKQRKAAKEIRVLIKQLPSLRAVFGVCGDAVTKLLSPLSGKVNMYPDMQEDLITTVLNISIHDSNKKLVAQNPVVIPLLVESLKFGTLKTRSNSAAALSTLSALDSNKCIIVKAGALKPLVDLLDEGQALAMNDAALAIFSLSVVHKNKGKVVSEGTIKVIMKKLKHRVLMDELLDLLALLSSHHKAIEEMAELGAVSCLLSIINEETSDHNKENCITILYRVCYNDRTKLKEVWTDESTNGTISNLARSGTSKAKQKANDILKQIDRYVSLVHTTPS